VYSKITARVFVVDVVIFFIWKEHLKIESRDVLLTDKGVNQQQGELWKM
jgi:hypothetical protein